ncbi:MAG: ribosome silencing factor [Parachlamydiaceae bacterium]|nr:ribosome silencing factor [Parachlamydiaceae bacterium]
MKEQNDSNKFLDVISQAIFDKKGSNIIALDVRGISTMTDYVIIAEGTVERHVKAIHTTVLDAMKQKGQSALHVEGVREGDWVVMDFGDIVIHLFIPELREKYSLESLWKEGKIVDLHIIVEPPLTANIEKTIC